MKRPARFFRVFGAVSLVASLLVGAFGVSSVAVAQADPWDPVGGDGGVYFPWVANDDESTGLGPADTAITIQNLDATEALITIYRGIGNDSLPGDNGWDVIGPFFLEAFASKTFSAAQLGIAPGEGAPVAVTGITYTGEVDSGFIEDYNQDGDYNDYEIVADDDNANGGNSWINTGTTTNADGTVVTWEDGDCLVVDIDPDGPDGDDLPDLSVYPPGYTAPGEPDVPGGTFPGQPGGNLDGNPANCTAAEAEEATDVLAASRLAGVAKQAVDGENLPYTSDADTAVSGYNGLAGWELEEVGNNDNEWGANGWYLPIVQTNGGPGGAWNSIIRVANFGDVSGGAFIGAAGVNVTFYPADNGAGELAPSFSVPLTINAGQTMMIDLSDHVPEGWVGSAHISADAPVFAMVDRVKVGYNMWITNTASNAYVVATNSTWGQGNQFVLFAPDVRKDFFGWNTGINVANLVDSDNTVTIQYLGNIGTSAQTATLHAKGMTYFYDPSQAPQDNNQQDPTTDPNANSGEIGAAILIADYPIAAAIDATKYPESTTSSDPNIFQALSYSATHNLWFDQSVPLVQKGDPNTGMGATSGIQLFNPNDSSTQATVTWYLSSGDTAGNPIPVVINPNSMTFVYSMNDAQLSVGFLGSATIDATNPIAVVSTQVDYQVQFDGSAVWNGYNPTGEYRNEEPVPDSIMDVFTYLTPLEELPDETRPPLEQLAGDASLQQAEGDVAIGGVEVFVYAEGDCGGDLLDSGVTDANGEVEFEVEPGYYCVEADPNNDGTVTSIDNVYIEPGDTDLDVDVVFIEEAVVAIADVTVQGTQCFDEVDIIPSAVACDDENVSGAFTVVTLVQVESLNVLCADVDYTDFEAYPGDYNPADGTFETPVVPGLYCAMADLDGDPSTVDKVYSAGPFEMPSADPEEDFANADEHLEWRAALDVQVNAVVGEGTGPYPNAAVQLFTGLDGEPDGVCDDTSMPLGTFYTDADGQISIPVLPGDYCGQIDGVTSFADATDAPLPLGDPADDQDILIEITSVADIQTQGANCVDDSDSPTACDETNQNIITTITLVQVEDANAACPTDPSAYDIATAFDFAGDEPPADPRRSFEASVIPGWYCGYAVRSGGILGEAFSIDPFEVQIGDPETDLDEHLGSRLDAVVNESSDPVQGVTVTFYTSDGTDGTDGCTTGTALTATDATNVNGKASIFVTGNSHYCAEITDGTTTTSGVTSVTLPLDDPNDTDITIGVATETPLVGIADIETAGPDCLVPPNPPITLLSTPAECSETNGVGMSVSIRLIQVADSAATCPTEVLDYATGYEALYDVTGEVDGTPVHSWEVEVPAGWYCAMADKDNLVYPLTPVLFSGDPFQVEAGDPETDLDENLGAILNIDLNIINDDLLSAPEIGFPISIYVGDATSSAGWCTASMTGAVAADLVASTDVEGKAQVVVNAPGDFCAQAFFSLTLPVAFGNVAAGVDDLPQGDPGDDTDITLVFDASPPIGP